MWICSSVECSLSRVIKYIFHSFFHHQLKYTQFFFFHRLDFSLHREAISCAPSVCSLSLILAIRNYFFFRNFRAEIYFWSYNLSLFISFLSSSTKSFYTTSIFTQIGTEPVIIFCWWFDNLLPDWFIQSSNPLPDSTFHFDFDIFTLISSWLFPYTSLKFFKNVVLLLGRITENKLLLDRSTSKQFI